MPLGLSASVFSLKRSLRLISRSLLLISILSVLTGTLAAQSDREAKKAEAKRLFDEGAGLYQEGTKDSLEKAIKKFQQARPLFQTVNDAFGEANALLGMGAAYSYLGQNQEALDSYGLALQLFRAAGSPSGEATTLNNMGLVYDSLGERQKALDSYALALPLYRAAGDRRGEAITLNNIGTVHNYLGERQKALENFALALPLFRAVGNRTGEATTFNNIGKVYIDVGDRKKALANFTLALPLFRAVGDRASEAGTLYNVAILERAYGKFTEARASIEAAIAIIESLRTKIVNQELRSSYFATVQNYYEFFIDLLMELHRQSPGRGHNGEALQISERARARALLEMLAEANADIRQGVDPRLIERERALQKELNAKAQEQMKLLNSPHTDAQASAIALALEALTREFQQVETRIRQSSPRYAALTQPQPLTLKEIQSDVLDRDTLLLEYSLGTERSYLWAVTTDSIESFTLPKREEIESTARRLYDILNARNQAVEGETAEQRRARVSRADSQYGQAAAELQDTRACSREAGQQAAAGCRRRRFAVHTLRGPA